MEVILLERISRLGGIGDVVKVKDGFGRNYLIPFKKALRASDTNKALFESQREGLEKVNAERRAAAQAQAATLEGVVATVIRQASDDGKLYGSVAVRDVAESLEAQGLKIDRRLIDLNTAIKNLGVYEVTINLHAEVPVKIKVHVARNADSPMPQDLVEAEETEKAQQALWAEQAAARAAAAAEVPAEDAATDEDAA